MWPCGIETHRAQPKGTVREEEEREREREWLWRSIREDGPLIDSGEFLFFFLFLLSDHQVHSLGASRSGMASCGPYGRWFMLLWWWPSCSLIGSVEESVHPSSCIALWCPLSTEGVGLRVDVCRGSNSMKLEGTRPILPLTWPSHQSLFILFRSITSSPARKGKSSGPAKKQ